MRCSGRCAKPVDRPCSPGHTPTQAALPTQSRGAHVRPRPVADGTHPARAAVAGGRGGRRSSGRFRQRRLKGPARASFSKEWPEEESYPRKPSLSVSYTQPIAHHGSVAHATGIESRVARRSVRSHSLKRTELSSYYLAGEVKATYGGMMIAIPEKRYAPRRKVDRHVSTTRVQHCLGLSRRSVMPGDEAPFTKPGRENPACGVQRTANQGARSSRHGSLHARHTPSSCGGTRGPLPRRRYLPIAAPPAGLRPARRP